ncbi:hypothetical protein GCM10007421_18650 [Halopseudomonas oceani]|nr:hypothetical protein GCM10007421_18650 [Halopseudomonas oceani]
MRIAPFYQCLAQLIAGAKGEGLFIRPAMHESTITGYSLPGDGFYRSGAWERW